MATKLSARVMTIVDGQELEIRYYVRSVAAGMRPFSRDGGASERDAWEGVEETSIFEGPGHCIESLSDALRATPEEAAADMWQVVARICAKRGARLTRGEMPEDLAASVRLAQEAMRDPALASDLSDA